MPLPNDYGATEVMGVTMNNKVMRPPVIDWKLIDVPELGYFHTDKPHPRGELLVKSHTVMQGYYKNPEATASVFDADGYYKTGDVMAQVGPDELDLRRSPQQRAEARAGRVRRDRAARDDASPNGDPLIHQAYLYGTAIGHSCSASSCRTVGLARAGVEPGRRGRRQGAAARRDPAGCAGRAAAVVRSSARFYRRARTVHGGERPAHGSRQARSDRR